MTRVRRRIWKRSDKSESGREGRFSSRPATNSLCRNPRLRRQVKPNRKILRRLRTFPPKGHSKPPSTKAGRQSFYSPTCAKSYGHVAHVAAVRGEPAVIARFCKQFEPSLS